jgi:4-diphosphocytidyl-2-C-methyl-D-erythritol kinase
MSLRALYNVPAPAKLNLFLHIVGRRADGYHLLESLFVLIDWADELHFELRDDGQLIRHDLGPALPADDLCQRAARALQRASGGNLGADIHIHKHVPWGAGMGGGSSDAATTLLALNRLWGLHWPREKLAQIGLTLGADVPFFIGGQNALVQGIGEQLWPVHVPPAHYAVLKPPVSLATREIFEHPGLVRDTKTVIVAGSLEGAGHGDLASGLESQNQLQIHPDRVGSDGFGKNDLQAPAEDRCTEVAQAARWLEARYGNSRMTGSGSAVFSRVGADSHVLDGLPGGLFSTESLGPNWLGRICRSLDQHPLWAWTD